MVVSHPVCPPASGSPLEPLPTPVHKGPPARPIGISRVCAGCGFRGGNRWPLVRITGALPRPRYKSTRRESNPLPLHWQCNALPIELLARSSWRVLYLRCSPPAISSVGMECVPSGPDSEASEQDCFTATISGQKRCHAHHLRFRDPTEHLDGFEPSSLGWRPSTLPLSYRHVILYTFSNRVSGYAKSAACGFISSVPHRLKQKSPVLPLHHRAIDLPGFEPGTFWIRTNCAAVAPEVKGPQDSTL